MFFDHAHGQKLYFPEVVHGQNYVVWGAHGQTFFEKVSFEILSKGAKIFVLGNDDDDDDDDGKTTFFAQNVPKCTRF